jgi:hypothetical protein
MAVAKKGDVEPWPDEARSEDKDVGKDWEWPGGVVEGNLRAGCVGCCEVCGFLCRQPALDDVEVDENDLRLVVGIEECAGGWAGHQVCFLRKGLNGAV